MKKLPQKFTACVAPVLAFAIICMGTQPAALAQDIPAGEGEPDSGDERGITDSGNAHTGIFHLNQSDADGTQQGNSFAIGAVADKGAAIVDTVSSQNADRSDFQSRSYGPAAITNAANQSAGLTAINQSAAPGSSQVNSAAIAFSQDQQSLALASAGAQISAGNSPSRTLDIAPSATIHDMANGTVGMVQVNQIAGNAGGQINLVAIAAAGNGIAGAEAIASGNSGSAAEIIPADAALFQPASLAITDSFNAMTGLAQVNQASGANNVQVNLVAAAFGQDAFATAISDTSLGNVSPAPDTLAAGEQDASADRPSLAGSFDGFVGVGQISQVSGIGNRTSNSIAVAVTHLPAAQP
ncbi:hypothetical protein [Altererythrobacter aquiaggeris]|uniref:hypothetical protein n=1 Tax=Aestuarierythrobacter aquiaggeris TaxID=1898396 RepID=UPI003019F70C